MKQPKFRYPDTDYQKVIDIYAKAWSTPDEPTRTQLLDECFAVNGEYIDPTTKQSSRKELNDHIGAFLAAYPGAVFQLLEPAQVVGEWYASFKWGMFIGGQLVLPGQDFSTLDNNGRLKQIIGFYDASGL